MARRNRRRHDDAPPPPSAAGLFARTESGPDGRDYVVRHVPAARAAKIYRCPGCDHEIRVGTAHLVAWPADGTDAAGDRRHWHTACWQNRANRSPTRRWS